MNLTYIVGKETLLSEIQESNVVNRLSRILDVEQSLHTSSSHRRCASSKVPRHPPVIQRKAVLGDNSNSIKVSSLVNLFGHKVHIDRSLFELSITHMDCHVDFGCTGESLQTAGAHPQLLYMNYHVSLQVVCLNKSLVKRYKLISSLPYELACVSLGCSLE